MTCYTPKALVLLTLVILVAVMVLVVRNNENQLLSSVQNLTNHQPLMRYSKSRLYLASAPYLNDFHFHSILFHQVHQYHPLSSLPTSKTYPTWRKKLYSKANVDPLQMKFILLHLTFVETVDFIHYIKMVPKTMYLPQSNNTNRSE